MPIHEFLLGSDINSNFVPIKKQVFLSTNLSVHDETKKLNHSLTVHTRDI